MPENLNEMPSATPQKKRPFWQIAAVIVSTRLITISIAWAIRPLSGWYIGLSCLGFALLGLEVYWPKKHRRFAPFVSIFVANFVLFIGLFQN